jgi:hypothetical protein
MPNRESPVAVAERHIAEAERRVARERELVAEPERDRHTAMAVMRTRFSTFCKRACGSPGRVGPGNLTPSLSQNRT